MRRDADVQAYGEYPAMSADGADKPVPGGDFVARMSGVFARELYQPMFQRAAQAPGDVRRLIAEFRDKLDVLDAAIATFDAPESLGAGLSPVGVPANDEPSSRGRDDRDALDDIGRNQRSRLRELTLLEAMARESRAYSLQQLISALEGKGFGDTPGAVVSQLHRLKKVGVINQPANGMYEITNDGLGHLRKLRSSFGGLLGDVR